MYFNVVGKLSWKTPEESPYVSPGIKPHIYFGCESVLNMRDACFPIIYYRIDVRRMEAGRRTPMLRWASLERRDSATCIWVLVLRFMSLI